MVKINDANDYESINIVLSEHTYPIMFREKVKELVEECGMTLEEARNEVEGMVIEVELYYEKGLGMFGIEAEAVECFGDSLKSPYTGEDLVDPHDND